MRSAYTKSDITGWKPCISEMKKKRPRTAQENSTTIICFKCKKLVLLRLKSDSQETIKPGMSKVGAPLKAQKFTRGTWF